LCFTGAPLWYDKTLANTGFEMSEFLPEKNRFRDDGETIYEFIDEFLVVCPICAQMAKVVLINNSGPGKIPLFAPRKLVCPSCAHIELSNGRKTFGGNGKDWYFQRPLWLQIACCGKNFWSYNRQHLDLLESYVSAKLRERKPNVNRSVASRLPNWIKSAKNRDQILKAIKKLKEKSL
jgi:hypothetical protein